MKLQWEYEVGQPINPVVDMDDKETIYAIGKGNRYYTVWYECNQFIGDVDNCQVNYGSKEYCIKACQDHDDAVG
jgi:hypothetical protein